MYSSSSTPSMPTNSNTHFNEKSWVIQIRKTLEEEFEEDYYNPIPVSIFNVPTTLISTHPEAYTPQLVALGPYHHWRQELYEMERYKIAAARQVMKHLKGFNTFSQIVDHVHKLEPKIRACYHKYLNISGETLAWMVAVDVCFLLEFLEVYTMKEGLFLSRVSSRMSHLVDSAGRKSAHIAILRDILMLENQIPLFLLRKMLEFEFGSVRAADNMLLLMLNGLSNELFPFKTPEELPKCFIEDSAHVLDFFYRLLMPKAFAANQLTEVLEEHDGEANEKDQDSVILDNDHEYVRKMFSLFWSSLSKIKKGPINSLMSLTNSKPVKLLLKLPWKFIAKFPGVNLLKEHIEHMFMQDDKENNEPEHDKTIAHAPLMEELTIPCVTELYKAGVRFVPTDGDICTIHFNAKTQTLSLPRVNLDVNTGIIMRNMVAYEACNASGPLIFTRYTEFMNGIVDTKDDAKLLREKGIVLNRLKSDEEVANLWNGMSRSVKLTKVPFLDKVVEDINKYYNGRWKVKAEKCIRGYIYGSWRLLTVLACVMILCLMGVQAVCSVYTCSRVLPDLDDP